MKFAFALFVSAVPIASAAACAQEPRSFELRDGNRVVFLGNTFIERDQVHGYLETMLTARWPDRNFTFRNLGWSGDTVWGEARARFGTPADGFQHLKEHIEAIQPTVLFVAYGGNEAFDDRAGLPRFEDGLRDLLNMLTTAAAPNVRIVLISPILQEDLGRPLPAPTAHNANLRLYASSIRRVANDQHYDFLNLVDTVSNDDPNSPHWNVTHNGIHLTPYGYWKVAQEVIRALGIAPADQAIGFDADGNLVAGTGIVLSGVAINPGRIRFTARRSVLPGPLAPRQEVSTGDAVLARRPFLLSLRRARHTLKVDGEVTAEFAPGESVDLARSPDLQQIEELRRTIIAKNRLYFHRWRPQNETYLFGFRKHEQGQNADEIPKFDPLVEELEARIAKLRVPTSHTYEIIRVDDK